MKDLLVIWMVVRISFEAVVWANLVWTRRSTLSDRVDISVLGLFRDSFLLGLKVMGAEPWLARPPLLEGGEFSLFDYLVECIIKPSFFQGWFARWINAINRWLNAALLERPSASWRVCF